jgi:UDP-N-acetylglucosamine:LPS N-acetylglucosamine transferase
LSLSQYKAAIVRGINQEKTTETPNNTDVYGMLNSDQLLRLINDSEIVICRSGYSSIMDLVALQKTAILVPTPGQTEQEYLADYLYKKGLFFFLTQKEFCIEKAIKNKLDFSPIIQEKSNDTLKERIKNVKFILENKENNKRNQ